MKSVESFSPLVFSSALASAIIFLALLICNYCVVADHERIDFLIGKMPADSWCPRFERFLCSSANPELLILSSSVGFVPSIMSDIKSGVVRRPTSVVELQRLSTHYECPTFLLSAMRNHGVENVSAAHMGIPTANMSDILLLLQKSLAYGKKPQVLLLPVNIRDFLVPPNWPAIDRLDQPIVRSLGDIPSVPGSLLAKRFFREVFVYSRFGYDSRIFDDARFYFTYELFKIVRPVPCLKSLVGQSDILRNRMAAAVEKDNHYDPAITGVPNSDRLSASEQNDILAFRNSNFEDAQFKAFEQIVSLAKVQGIKLVIVDVPLYPGMQAPAIIADRYRAALNGAQCQSVFVLYAASGRQYSQGEYSDLLHLNGLGGERLFWRISEFFAAHKVELFGRKV